MLSTCSETSQENVHLRDPEKGLKKEGMEGTWVVGWVELWILNFDSHHDLRLVGWTPQPPIRLHSQLIPLPLLLLPTPARAPSHSNF